MDEPMEEEVCDSSGNVASKEEKRPKSSSILRPGSMVMMTITTEDYEQQYWPKLEGAINHLLTMTPGDYIPISYEQMYSCVYKCVCKQFSERLYKDLLEQISNHLEDLCVQLQKRYYELDSKEYVEKFNFSMNQYLQAMAGIATIFIYMNRFYIESKLKTDLQLELKKLFVTCVAEKHINNLIPILADANTKPFSVSPPVMSSIIKNLHALKPDFSAHHPQLFAKYIPNILPPSTPDDIQHYIDETAQMQRDLKTHPLYTSGDQSRKRPTEDDVQSKFV
ncbi:unnamed protein product [Owenia fusiformis]|uniref:Uncharacterized protein n=1 Tax=Owenia fusiformis TaxID=6347 RepID=A0A8J1T7Q5_OWEFU|nr:unnamed protein product [Owenia fusiformis]